MDTPCVFFLSFFFFWPTFASFRTDPALYEASGCEEWGEGLQGWLHCVSRQRGEGRSRNEHSVQEAGYLPRFYGLCRDYAGAERQLEGRNRAWRAIPGALANHACVWGSADRRPDQRRNRVYAGILQECPPRSAGRAKSAAGDCH